MSDADFPSKINDPLNSGVQGLDPINPNTSSEGGKRPFSDYMQEPQAPHAPQAPSPMQALAPTATTTPPTTDSVNNQLRSTSTQLGDLNQKLNTPNLKLKPSQKFLIRSKLEDAHQNIRDSATKLGVDVGPAPNLKDQPNPIAKFLAMIEDGQNQIEGAQQMIEKNSQDGKLMDPGQLLLVQTKLNRAQQQIDFSSVVLAKAIDSLKTLFNVQI